MSVQMQQFRVVGVDTETGKDVSVVIDAATKAAAEVKAEHLNIETTHIVRIKQDDPIPPDEHELFSAEAAEALSGKRTDKLIEEVASPDEVRPATPTPAPSPTPQPVTHAPEQMPLMNAVARTSYSSPSSRNDAIAAELSGFRAFTFVLLFVGAICAGAYFVLVHEPNAVDAQEQELVFGDDLFTDVIEPGHATQNNTTVRDAFNKRPAVNRKPGESMQSNPDALLITPNTTPRSSRSHEPSSLTLQSVVTSHEGRFAVINGKLYKQGSTIAGQTLLNVADDWVLLEQDGKQRVLQIDTNN